MQKAVVSKINGNTDNIKDETINMKDIVTKNLQRETYLSVTRLWSYKHV